MKRILLKIMLLLISTTMILSCGGALVNPEGLSSSSITLKDQDGNILSSSGAATNVDPSSFTLTFSEAMSDSTIVTSLSADVSSKAAGDSGNITYTCSDGTIIPDKSIVKSESEENTYILTVEEAWRYALLTCVLTVSTNVQTVDGFFSASDIPYTMTNACAINDDFNAVSKECWNVVDLVGFSTWGSWIDIPVLTFETENSSLDYDASLADTSGTRFILSKQVNVSSDGFEIVIHFDSQSGLNFSGGGDDNNEVVAFLTDANLFASLTSIALGIRSVSGTAKCEVNIEIPSLFSDPGRARADCPSGSENGYWVRFAVDSTSFSYQYSTGPPNQDGTINYDDLTPGVGKDDITKFTLSDVQTHFSSDVNLYIWLIGQDFNQEAMASVDELIFSGVTGRGDATGQY